MLTFFFFFTVLILIVQRTMCHLLLLNIPPFYSLSHYNHKCHCISLGFNGINHHKVLYDCDDVEKLCKNVLQIKKRKKCTTRIQSPKALKVHIYYSCLLNTQSYSTHNICEHQVLPQILNCIQVWALTRPFIK